MTAPAPVHIGINCSAGFLGDPVKYGKKFVKNVPLLPISFDDSSLKWFSFALPLILYQVLQHQINGVKLLERAIQLTTGNQSQLNKLLQSGDVSQAVQLAKAAIVAVDDDERIPKDKLKESRKAVSAQQLIKSNCSLSAFSTAREVGKVLRLIWVALVLNTLIWIVFSLYYILIFLKH